jgi:hypothetical protein
MINEDKNKSETAEEIEAEIPRRRTRGRIARPPVAGLLAVALIAVSDRLDRCAGD